MCELFGFSSAEPVAINDWLKEFYTHSDQHPHGWGLALLNGHEASIEKEPVQATKSRYL
ncbi:MAG: class II glutamine amidotransferase, partial [Butyricicoccaceae bacterium]